MSNITHFADNEAVTRDNFNKRINEINVKIDETSPTLTHSKTGIVHKLTGVIPSAGLVTAKFKATADFVEGDTFSINEVPYTALDILGKPISGFKSSSILSVHIDVPGLKINFSGGGGSGGSFVGPTPPTDTKLSWIDTSIGGVLKYYNGAAWVATTATWA